MQISFRLRRLRFGARACNLLSAGGILPRPAIQHLQRFAEPRLLYQTAGLRYQGSNWFTNAEAALMAEMVHTGALDLSPWETRAYPLERTNDALSDIKQRPGGFVNMVVQPDR